MNALAPRLAGRPIERRKHSRVRVSLLGRYMLADRHEYPCQTIDMSPGGMRLTAPVKGEPGSRCIAYLEHVGRIEGIIVRKDEEGFALSITATPRKRDKLAAQLTWLANRHILNLPEDRRHTRVVPRITRSVIKTPDGKEHMVRLVDISLSGAAFDCDMELMIGDPVELGRTQCRVVRKFATGYAVEFRNMLASDALNENIQL
jgi:c-di-GMP-binding flagellar brake protein YcgR